MRLPTPFVGVPEDGSFGAEWGHELGARGYRLTIDLDHNQPAYLDYLRGEGLETYLTVDTDTFAGIPWHLVRQDPESVPWRWEVNDLIQYIAARYRGCTYLNPWNELDGVGFESSSMRADVVNEITAMFRAAMGPGQTIVAASLVSGDPTRLRELDLSQVNGVDLHLYTGVSPSWPKDDQGPNGERRLDFKIAGYVDVLRELGAAGLFVCLSELGWSSLEGGEDYQAAYCADVMGYLLGRRDLRLVSWFSLHPYAGWGLLRDDGTRKPSFERYQRAVREATMPPPEFIIGDGVRKDMAANGGDSPATDEIYHPIGAAPGKHQYSETFGTSGTRYVYVFSTNKTHRFSPTS